MVESSCNVMAHGDAREGTWRGNWRMGWVASFLHTASEHSVSSITTADVHTLAGSSRLNWRPRRFKWTRPFRRKTKSGFCACAITFQTQSMTDHEMNSWSLVGSVLGSWTVQQAGGWPMSHHDVTAVLSAFTTNDMAPLTRVPSSYCGSLALSGSHEQK